MVYDPPNWLPEEICVSPWSHNYTYNMLYGHFCTYIRDAGLRYGGYRVIVPKEIEDGKEKIFWHLTSRNKWVWNQALRRKVKERFPELARCSRISWINPIITHSSDQEVLAWDYLEGDKEVKTYLWLKDHDFVVIFKKFPDGNRLLITSFYVDIKHKKEDLERKYRDRIQ
jgi:hypothetical protein